MIINSIPAVSLKTAILLPLGLSLVALLVALMYSFFYHEEQSTREYVRDTFTSTQGVYDLAVKADTEKLSTALELIVQDKGLRQAMMAKDRDALLQRSAPIFEKLRKEYGITHYYFHGPDRVNILRVHQPGRFGDKINRFTALNAEASGKPAAGLELGPLGTFTLRVVFPWYEGKRLLGYVELGEEIEQLLVHVKDVGKVNFYVTIDKQYLSQQDWLAGMKLLKRQGNWDFLPESVVTFQTTPSVSAPIWELFRQHFPREQTMKRISYEGRTFKAMPVPLTDAGGREVGQMLLTRDITSNVARGQHQAQIVAGLGLAIGGFLFGLFSLITGRVSNQLESSSAALNESEERFRSLVESTSDWIWDRLCQNA